MLESSTLTVKAKVMPQNSTKPLVTVSKVSLVRNRKQILKDVSFTLAPGEIISLIGPNGAGKSSLVKCITGIWKITSGCVTKASDIRIGYMPQAISFDPSLPMTVERFLQLGQNAPFIQTVLQEVGVAHVAKSQLNDLSGGEWQRVLLARALMRKPDLLVLDEPAQGVDLVGQDELYHLIRTIRDQYRCAILLVSHDLNLVMAKTDKVLCLNQHICCFGSPQVVGQDPAFLSLFGHIPEMAIYTHEHDHQHDVAGDIVIKQKDESNE